MMSTRGDIPAVIGPERYSERTILTSLEELDGLEVRGIDGERIGRIDDTYVDEIDGYARYVAVKTGWFGAKRHVIPVDDVRLEDIGDERFLSVPYTKAQLAAAPVYETEEELTRTREREIFAHYNRLGYWEAVRARQTTPAPTPEIAEAEVADAMARGEDPLDVRVRPWGAA
jgi:sporulation protein YlmC with PRC-barrel domain